MADRIAPPTIRLTDAARDRVFRRYYDAKAAQQIALRDGWGSRDAEPGMSRKQIAALAVREDFERLRAWRNGEWCHVGVIVTPIPADEDASDVETDYTYALRGIESDCTDYIKDTALELAGEASA